MSESDQSLLFEAFGRAVFQAQILEEVLVGQNIAHDETLASLDKGKILEIENKLRGENLGRLIQWWRDKGNFHETVTDEFEKAKDKRNFLVHRFFREHPERNLKIMLDEIKVITDTLKTAQMLAYVLAPDFDIKMTEYYKDNS